MLGQHSTKVFGNAAHFVERRHSAKIDPMPELLYPHLDLRLGHAE
jgi:hypothetical protein